MDNYKNLIQKIRECAWRVRLNLTPGYLESVYRNALLVELRKADLCAEKEKPLVLKYYGEVIGDFRADIVVENKIIIELKAVSEIHPIHAMQLVNYLKVTGLDIGVLINYGSEEYTFLPKYRTLDLLNLNR